MAQGNHNELNLYEEAKAGLFSLVQQTVAVFIGFVLMLLVAGGAPSSFVIALSFCLGTAFVAWSEQKRVRNLKAVDSSIPPKESETASIVTEERSNKNSSTLDIQTLRQQRLLEDLKILEEQLMTTSSVPDKFRLREQIRSLKSEIGSFLGGVRLGVEGDYYNVMSKQISLEITSDWITVGGSSYTTNDIDRTTKVGLKTNMITLMSAGRKFAVLMRHKHEYIVLVSSRDEEKIDQVVDALKNAIAEARRGNRSYSQVIQMNGDYVNMSGNFGSGFSKGEININQN
jgi:hypothetical protein